ncbi:MAG TPA: lysophospholipid acyltransferase family protein [Planctomycetaceae bacterium]|nr:lysophospholipid acyltransferase family protein [Planctomycetaceae bacterium]
MKIRSRWLTAMAAWLSVAVFRLLLMTCRQVHLAPEPRLRLDYPPDDAGPERFILCVWHDALIVPTFASPRRNRLQTCCLVSRHQDGGYLAEAMALLGYSTVRGSTNRGGAQAIKQLMDDTAGKHIVITPDGPRGPRREVKRGAVFLASQTGRRICAGAYVARSEWRIKGSWTDMAIPKPFTTIYLLTSEPITVPGDLSRPELNRYTQVVQDELHRLTAEAEALARGETTLAGSRDLRAAA